MTDCARFAILENKPVLDLYSKNVSKGKKSEYLNEEETISLIWKVLSGGEGSRKTGHDPFADDAAWVPNQKNQDILVAKADMFVQDTDAPPQMSPAQMASKALTSAVSDFAAKGVKPSYCFISIAIPKNNSSLAFVTSLAYGLRQATRRYGLRIIGGDTNASKGGLVIDVPMFGFAHSVTRRSGSRIGDCVGVSARFGLQAAGLEILLHERTATSQRFQRKAIKAVQEPRARLALGLSISRYLSSCTDSSDGLAFSLYHLAESSVVDICLDQIPIESGVDSFAKRNRLNPNDLVFFGGEEYELVMTFAPENRKRLEAKGIITIGKVKKCDSQREPAVYVEEKKIPRKGWLHNQ